MRLRLTGFASTLAATLMATAAWATDLPKPHEFTVLGTWNTLSPFSNYEEPLWSERLPGDSEGKLDTNITSMSVLGIKGYEAINLIKRGVFDFGHATIAYVTGSVPEMEGIDLAGVATDMAAARRNADAYRDEVNRYLVEREGVRMLAVYPFSSQFIFCKEPISGIEDLAGKKIRTSSATHADFITGAGATNVTITFAEVVPALQKGVVDCAVTGSMSAYGAKWPEVVTTVYALPLNMGLSALFVNEELWSGLDTPTRDFLTEQIKAWEDHAWAGLAAEDAEGIACLTGDGDCSAGSPADLDLVAVSDADMAARERILHSHVFPNWLERCGTGCKDLWNSTIGTVAEMTIE